MARRTALNYIWKDRKRTFLGLPFSFTRYKLTEDRLFIETGFFSRNEDEIRLYRIMDVSLTRSFGQRLLGLGTIHCCSADKSMGEFNIENIKKPRLVKELLSQAIEKERLAKRVINREDMGHGHGNDDFPEDDLHHEHDMPGGHGDEH